MKKMPGLISVSSLLFLLICANEAKTTEAAKPAAAPAKTEVIVVQPAAPTVIVKDPPAKPTTITLDKNGVKVGTKKVEVVIKKDDQ